MVGLVLLLGVATWAISWRLSQKTTDQAITGVSVDQSDVTVGTSSAGSTEILAMATQNIPTKTALVKSVRLDLSTVDIPSNMDRFADNVLSKLKDTGANTVFLSPWSDGRANYRSRAATRSDFGRAAFVEKFLTKAHQKKIKVYAWYVTAKDTFLPSAHPDWYARTIKNKQYKQEDEPGLFLPVASLVNDNYLKFHLSVLTEATKLPFDGWVISEPLVGWGDRYDDTYTDFSSSAIKKFTKLSGVDPRQIFNQKSSHYVDRDQKLYRQWINWRASTVTEYVRQNMAVIRKSSTKPIIITVFTEPNQRGQLKSLASLKEWLGTDIAALAKLKPSSLEIQDLFLDFEHPQTPAWVSSMVKQFHRQVPNVPLMVSVEGFDSNKLLTAADFSTAIKTAMGADITGVSFYAYDTLRPAHWAALKKLWK